MQVSWCAVSGLLDHLLHAPSTGEGAVRIRGCEECAQCDGTHEYTLLAHRGQGALGFPPTQLPPHSCPHTDGVNNNNTVGTLTCRAADTGKGASRLISILVNDELSLHISW